MKTKRYFITAAVLLAAVLMFTGCKNSTSTEYRDRDVDRPYPVETNTALKIISGSTGVEDGLVFANPGTVNFGIIVKGKNMGTGPSGTAWTVAGNASSGGSSISSNVLTVTSVDAGEELSIKAEMPAVGTAGDPDYEEAVTWGTIKVTVKEPEVTKFLVTVDDADAIEVAANGSGDFIKTLEFTVSTTDQTVKIEVAAEGNFLSSKAVTYALADTDNTGAVTMAAGTGADANKQILTIKKKTDAIADGDATLSVTNTLTGEVLKITITIDGVS